LVRALSSLNRTAVNRALLQADETSEILKIPAQYHSGLIGHGGKYVIRLEEKYNIKITFPRSVAEGSESRTRENLKPDEVFLKGGKKGVAGAKSELLDAAEFEKESNNVVQFTVPSRAIPRILGKGGAIINQIKDDTDAAIDLDKAEDGSEAAVTCRGSKKAITAAKAAIQSIVDQMGEEVTEVLTIENKFHKALIGGGGQGLRNLIVRCGGPADPKIQAGLVRLCVLTPLLIALWILTTDIAHDLVTNRRTRSACVANLRSSRN
jgi:predicted PilT family ATPase